jgi:hypothetical protein
VSGAADRLVEFLDELPATVPWTVATTVRDETSAWQFGGATWEAVVTVGPRWIGLESAVWEPGSERTLDYVPVD